jgi:hypothetical protein
MEQDLGAWDNWVEDWVPCGRGAGCGRGRGFGVRFRTRLIDNVGCSDMYPYDKDALQTKKQELEAQLNWINNELNKEQ